KRERECLQTHRIMNRPSGVNRKDWEDAGGPFVEARLRGPNHAKIVEQADIIARDFKAAVDRLTQKRKERPNEPIDLLYYEEPFHSDAVAEQQRLIEEDMETLRGQTIPNDFEVMGTGIPVITVAEEARLNANLQKKKHKEDERKRKSAAWNPDQNNHSQPIPVPKAAAFSRQEESRLGCTSCNGPCVLDSRRSIMSCTNEPMLPELMADLLGQFYRLGWMTGSGGAMAAISCDNRLLLSPSSLQKERIKPCDLFASAPNSMVVKQPTCCPNGKPTACEGIFKKIMNATGAQCVIHSHSKSSNLATRIIRTSEWAMSGQEFIKGIYNYKTKKNMDNEDVLIVPIIENMPQEEDLEPQIEAVLANPQFSHVTAILVRNHGVFVWGPTWQKTKIMTEVYDYLFDLSLDLMKMGVPLIRQEDLGRAVRLGILTPPTPELAAAYLAISAAASAVPA
ncbi:hypothetical protein PFISCL1PPCAC_27513, partial [Pristionchus fissidentatus]